MTFFEHDISMTVALIVGLVGRWIACLFRNLKSHVNNSSIFPAIIFKRVVLRPDSQIFKGKEKDLLNSYTLILPTNLLLS